MVALRTASQEAAGDEDQDPAAGKDRAAQAPGWSWFWLAFAAVYLLVPLYSTLQFSLQTGAHRYGLSWYGYILQPAAVPAELRALAPPCAGDRRSSAWC